MVSEKILVAWNAAYWLARSEASRQLLARYPDCDWNAAEEHEDVVSSVVAAQAELCLQAMHGRDAGVPHVLSVPMSVASPKV